MSQEEVEREMIRVLRAHVLLGSDREIATTSPLGAAAGLDSLGVMEFLSAAEERFEVVFPDTLWTDRRQFTIRRLAEYVVAVGERVTP